MPTNEERKDRAAMLRKVDINKYYKSIGAAINELEAAIGCGYAYLPYRLAELIEPEPERTCRNITRHPYYGFKCSECNWEAYEPNDYGNDVCFDAFNFCPYCGSKVVEQ